VELDSIGWFIVTMHQLIGHDKTAVVIGVDTGDKAACIICLYEAGKATSYDVIQAIGSPLPRPVDRDRCLVCGSRITQKRRGRPRVVCGNMECRRMRERFRSRAVRKLRKI